MLVNRRRRTELKRLASRTIPESEAAVCQLITGHK